MKRKIGGKIRAMRTINRSPIEVYSFLDTVSITWKCHGIDEDGNRQRWYEYTRTPHPGFVPLHEAYVC